MGLFDKIVEGQAKNLLEAVSKLCAHMDALRESVDTLTAEMRKRRRGKD